MSSRRIANRRSSASPLAYSPATSATGSTASERSGFSSPTSPRRGARPRLKPVLDHKTVQQVSSFLNDYSKDGNFEAFTIKVDDTNYVAVSLFHADDDLQRLLTTMPPTPMRVRKHGAVAFPSPATSTAKKGPRLYLKNAEDETPRRKTLKTRQAGLDCVEEAVPLPVGPLEAALGLVKDRRRVAEVPEAVLAPEQGRRRVPEAVLLLVEDWPQQVSEALEAVLLLVEDWPQEVSEALEAAPPLAGARHRVAEAAPSPPPVRCRVVAPRPKLAEAAPKNASPSRRVMLRDVRRAVQPRVSTAASLRATPNRVAPSANVAVPPRGPDRCRRRPSEEAMIIRRGNPRHEYEFHTIYN
ncbi:unnamed protein product [Caenorhabditis auriculariae]|uniref:Uncharacterized protein n=1 Tax=Caenorhabditis auriculariae TaxID=2777116 RepID=A0A8S1HYP4_9PELO|nr:unnamed protein product [Caenorhabditis auriculariae]